jgi:uncharacterized DUF497 family protein
VGLDLNIHCRPNILTKLQERHNVSLHEVRQCFINRDGGFLEDNREEHKTNPPTEWFIAETNQGRLLKVCFVQIGTEIDIKTAYEPNEDEIRIYKLYAF